VLTRLLRSAGVMRGIIATGDVRSRALVDRASRRAWRIRPVLGVTCERAFD
jgi:hypothetical protein